MHKNKAKFTHINCTGQIPPPVVLYKNINKSDKYIPALLGFSKLQKGET